MFFWCNKYSIFIYNIMKSKCLVFGNCQMYIIQELLKDTHFNTLYDCDLFSSHINTCEDLDNIYLKLDKYELILIQPHYNYRNNSKYNINSIVKHVNKDCKIIIIPSSYFNFYYPYLTYAYSDDTMLRSPSDYHDKNFISLYNVNKKEREKENKKDIKEEYKKMLNDKSLMSKDELKKMANGSIAELKRRENAFMTEDYGVELDYKYIVISDFIKDNYKKKLLFYSMNHPTYYLFEYVTNEVLKVLDLEIYMNTFKFSDPLSNLHPPIYKCVENVVKFNTGKYFPVINNIVDIDKISDMYIESYKKCKNIRY